MLGDGSISDSNLSGHEKFCSQLSLAILSLTFSSFLIGAVILVILSFTKRRKNICRDCCNGRPGLIVPLDMLGIPQHRLVYASIFGLMTDTFLSLIIDDSATSLCSDGGFTMGNILCKTVVSPLIFVAMVCFLYAPLFVCVDPHPYPLLGHLLGLLYTSIVATLYGVNLSTAFKKCNEDDSDAEVIGDLPVFAFLIGLLGWFLFKTIIDIANLSDHSSEQVNRKKSYHIQYVRGLLEKKNEFNGFLHWIWPYEKGFKYPLKFVAVMVVAITILFKFTYQTLYLGAIFERDFKPRIEEFLKNSSLEGYFNLDAISGAVITAPFISSALCLILLLHMTRTIHIHMKLMARGQFKITVNPHKHLLRLVHSLSYFGSQIGFFVWAWLIYYVIALLIPILGIFAVKSAVLTRLFIITPIVWILWILVVYGVMVLCCKFVFLDKMESDARLLSVTNRNLFNWFSYFFVIYHTIVGFLVAILRLILSLLFGTLLLFRLDRNIMMDGFHLADYGHSSYLAFLYVEHTHNNSIVHVFVSLLADCVLGVGTIATVQHRLPQNQSSVICDSLQLDSETSPLVSSKRPSANSEGCAASVIVTNNKQMVRNRWLVAYTLFHNPGLRPLRAHKLQEQRRVVLREDSDKDINHFAS